MQIAYIIFAIIIICLVVKRRFDFVSIGSIFFLLYTSNCLIGEVWIDNGGLGLLYASEISTEAYLIIFAQMTIIIIVLLWLQIIKPTRRKKQRIRTQVGFDKSFQKKFWTALLCICFAIFFYSVVFEIGLFNFFSYDKKSDLTESLSLSYSIAVWGIIACFINSVKSRDKKTVIVSAIPILFLLVLGSRSYAVVAGIGALIVIASSRKGEIGQFKASYFLLGIFAAFVLIVFKDIYQALRALDFVTVAEILVDGDTYSDLFNVDEFRINMALFNYAVTANFILPVNDILARILSILPLANDYIATDYPIRFSSINQNYFFGASYGLGNSFWAETYSMGGLIFLLIMTFVWMILLNISSKFIVKETPMAALPLVLASYGSFYICRLDWVQLCGCAKALLFIWCLWLIWSLVFSKIRTKE